MASVMSISLLGVNMKTTYAAVMAAVLTFVFAAEAVAMQSAQNAPMFERNRNASVSDRASQAFEGANFQQGAFLISAGVGVGLQHNNNVFAENSGEESDVALVITPALSVDTTWSRHAMNFNAAADFREYQDYDTENAVTTRLGLGGRLDVVRGNYIEGEVSYIDGVEDRSTPGPSGQAREPVEFDQVGYGLSATREFGRYRIRAGADLDVFDFKDGIAADGSVLDLDFRDREQSVFSLRGDLAISPDTSLFARLSVNSQDYDLAPPAVAENRNSDGHTASIGADFDITALARGSIAVGYTEQDFDAAAFGDIGSLSVQSSVDWFVTRLSTVTFNASRSINESAVLDAPGSRTTTIGVGVAHELRRNIIVTADVDFRNDDYIGIDRTDDTIRAGVGIKYFFNENFGVGLNYQHADRASEGFDGGVQNFSRDIVGISFTWRP